MEEVRHLPALRHEADEEGHHEGDEEESAEHREDHEICILDATKLISL